MRGTDLEKDYLAGKFRCLAFDEYYEIVKEALDILPETIVIHRMTGDGDKRILIAPEWSKDKKKVMDRMFGL